MAHRRNYMLSGLERELELYMGEEFEVGPPITIPATVKSRKEKDVPLVPASIEVSPETAVNIKFEIDKDERTGTITVTRSDNGSEIEKRKLTKIEAQENGTRVTGKYIAGLTVVMTIEETMLTVVGTAPWPVKEAKRDSYQTTPEKAQALIEFINTNLPQTQQEFEEEYEDGSPTNVYQKILAKVDYINDSSLTRKPGQKTPVQITFDFNLGSKKLTISAKQLDIQYVYDVKDLHRLKSNSTGTIVKGPSTNTYRYGYMKLEIGKVPYLTIRAFRTESPTGYGDVLKDDGYILEDEKEAQKLRNMFLALLNAGEITPLDQELEFEFDDDEFELDDIGARNDLGYEYEYEDDDDFADAPEDEFELEYELDALEDGGVTENFARRLHELSTRSFESEYELDIELDSALDAVENEFMVKRLRRKRKKGKRKGLFKKILNTGAKIVGKVAGRTPIGSLIKAGTSLVRGNVKGALGNLAKAAVGTALGPVAGTAATAAIDALGGGEEGEVSRGGRRRRAIRRVARIARDTYREVADTLPEDFDHPLVAHEVARKAVRKAMIKNGVKPPGRVGGAPQQKRVIQLRPGEKVVIVRS